MSAGIFYLAIYVLIIFGIRIGLYKLFEKAGEAGWKAFVPVYSEIIWVKLIGKPIWWVPLKFIPIARTLIRLSMNIELVKAFGKYEWKDQAYSVLTPFVYFPYLGFQPERKVAETPATSVRKKATQEVVKEGVSYMGIPDEKAQPKRSGAREWADAILYAGTAAVIIRTIFMEAFMIPTTSMERTLRAGDFLFVSKFHYGTRLPMIPLAIPFIHNKIPVINLPSYLDFIRLPYYRLPGISEIKRNDIVVFNYPAHDIHDLGDGAGMVQPVSMKENYIKRCVGMPGDVLEVKNAELWINGKPAEQKEHLQLTYTAEQQGQTLSPETINELGFRPCVDERRETGNEDFFLYSNTPKFMFFAPKYTVEQMKKFAFIKDIKPVILPDSIKDQVYPYRSVHQTSLEHNNRDNFGPIKIPKKGEAIPLTEQNYRLYIRPITAYEGRQFEAKNGKFFIDGKETTSYVPNMNYYWMMGDNRHNSDDSRFWGFVPEDHIIGTPVFIFMSYESAFGFRFSRIGTSCIK